MMPEAVDFGASGPCSNTLKVISNFNVRVLQMELGLGLGGVHNM